MRPTQREERGEVCASLPAFGNLLFDLGPRFWFGLGLRLRSCGRLPCGAGLPFSVLAFVFDPGRFFYDLAKHSTGLATLHRPIRAPDVRVVCRQDFREVTAALDAERRERCDVQVARPVVAM